MSKLIPTALYPCKICRSEYSWPADDLFWSEKDQAWICRECWGEEEHGEHGISLEDEIKAQNANASERERVQG